MRKRISLTQAIARSFFQRKQCLNRAKAPSVRPGCLRIISTSNDAESQPVERALELPARPTGNVLISEAYATGRREMVRNGG